MFRLGTLLLLLIPLACAEPKAGDPCTDQDPPVCLGDGKGVRCQKEKYVDCTECKETDEGTSCTLTIRVCVSEDPKLCP